MAIQKMDFVTIIGPVEQFDSIIERIYKGYEFHFENALEIMRNISGLHAFSEENKYLPALKKLMDTISLMELETQFVPFESNLKTEEEIHKFCEDLIKNFEVHNQSLNRLDSDKRVLEEIILQLMPLMEIEAPVQNFLNMEFVKFRFGKMSVDNYKKYNIFIEESENVIYVPIYFAQDSVWGFYFTTSQNLEAADSLFGSLYFEIHTIPNNVIGTAREIVALTQVQIEAINMAIDKINDETKTLIEENEQEILSCYSQVKCQNDVFEVRKYCVRSKKEFYISGWLGADEVVGFKEEFDPEPLINYIVEKAENMEHNVSPPTKLKNFWAFQPFEEFVKMYGLPSYGEFDPTPFMAITYVLLFGIMFGDVGQGFCVFLLGLFLSYRKINLGKILVGCSISSMIFGCFYGSVFGFEDIIIGFRTLESSANINLTIMASIALGVVLVSAAMLINIYNGIRQKNIEKIFFHYNGISGFVFYWGVIFAVLSMFGFGMSRISPFFVVFAVIIPLVLIYLKEPLTKLAEKKKDWKPKNLGEYLVENIFELFEVVLSYITNTVSFMRVGAFALNHAGMMLAVFILSRMFGESQNIVVIILGNLFVMGMEGLIVGIQVLRLEFYEMFSRFFAGEGKAFVPLKIMNEKK